jgi:4-carboxymuconolactone decarboxylase
MTQRFAPIAPSDWTDAQRAVAQALIDGPRGGLRGPFPALLRRPQLAERVRQLGDSVRFESELPAALREFCILMTARFWSARYEWHAHSQMALKLGVPRSVIEDLGHGRRPQGLDAEQALAWQVCHEVLDLKDISDTTYAQALSRWGEPMLMDLLATVAYFGFVSVVLNAIRYPVPEGGEVLPDLPNPGEAS